MTLRALPLLVAVVLVGAVVGCTEPDPKAECVRYKVEMQELDGRWSAHPPIGMDLVEESNYRLAYEAKHPNYANEKNAVRERFGRTLRTSNIDQFCQSYG